LRLCKIRGCGTGLEALAARAARAQIQPSRSVEAAQSRQPDVFHFVFSPQKRRPMLP
jgi:hypothetical protein